MQVIAEKVASYPVDAVGIRPVFVIRHFVLDENCDDDAAGEANCQSEDVDRTEQRIAGDVAKGDLEIILKHGEPHRFSAFQ